ncbi:hypothetical protein [uncultured Brevundimonas sp.]|uniref:hypothetical protein n=1 Tax=uncultured Brevundimonas sp. TaxID=213418 RepID=UPI002635E595|nr:hypothetical protein [uncultured Brevundimonas sp.]
MTQVQIKERPISEPVGRRILTVDQIDDLGEAIIMLAREIHVITDRVLVLEEILQSKGIDVSGIDDHQPSAETQAKIDARCDAILTNVMRALRVGD